MTDWAAYFADYYAAQRPEVKDEAAPDEIEVLEAAHDISPQDAPGAPKTLAKRLADQGWSVRVRASAVWAPATLYATSSEGYNKGDIRHAAHRLETYQVIGKKVAAGQMLAVVATWERKEGRALTFSSAMTHDPYLGREYRPSVTKPRPQREWEKAEGVNAPLGLNQWLDIVCPKPAPKNKDTK